MKIIKEENAIIGFSSAEDGDLSFYLMSDDQMSDVWLSLPQIKELEIKEPAFLKQVHGDEVFILKKPQTNLCATADAVYTRLTEQAVGVFSADCLPLIIFSDKACAAVHAGWRGSLLDIAGKAVGRFVENGCSADSLVAHIGPCIGQCCLEMGEEVFEEFLSHDVGYKRFFEKRRKWHLNLRELNRYQLERAGVKPEKIFIDSPCTFCREKDFFSFRRQKKRNGSMFSFVVRREKL